ncbi:hypothetical protein MNEG_12370, partial [Monoraphidium neglectum]
RQEQQQEQRQERQDYEQQQEQQQERQDYERRRRARRQQQRQERQEREQRRRERWHLARDLLATFVLPALALWLTFRPNGPVEIATAAATANAAAATETAAAATEAAEALSKFGADLVAALPGAAAAGLAEFSHRTCDNLAGG